MKKNIAMRVAAFLFILTMISTCAFATTFAKYTSYGEVKDSARVAKWGVVVEATIANDGTIFADEYDGTVQSSEEVDVVAPGTQGELVKFTVEGTPEVDAQLTYDVVFELSSGWAVEGEYYCPIIITVNEEDYIGNNYASAAEFIAAVTNAITKCNKKVEAASEQGFDEELTVNWRWEITSNTDTKQTDKKDTALGDVAANTQDLTIKLEVSCTVEQID